MRGTLGSASRIIDKSLDPDLRNSISASVVSLLVMQVRHAVRPRKRSKLSASFEFYARPSPKMRPNEPLG
jgi:hypothetical protein